MVYNGEYVSTVEVRVQNEKVTFMSQVAIPLPVTVEQTAAAIQQMSPDDQERLLELIPSLRSRAGQLSKQTVT